MDAAAEKSGGPRRGGRQTGAPRDGVFVRPGPSDYAAHSDDGGPLLMVVIDTEEEFDWAQPLSRENTSVASIVAQPLAQEIFAKYGIVPTYVIDYPVATSETAVEVLAGLARQGQCEIGAHLHPWVNPPYDETVNPRNSYPGNLPPELERAKLSELTAAIDANFGSRPTVYKAGRYGVGPNTPGILEALGYTTDVSVVPFTDFGDDGGPDFTDLGYRPYWFGGEKQLLEIPLSCGFHGFLAGHGQALYPMISGNAGMKLRIPGVLARLGVLERIRLTPEGAGPAEHRRLTRALLAQGCRLFSFTYHSPSLAPGHTPYVRDKADLAAFLAAMDEYFDFFMNRIGGRPTTPADMRRRLWEHKTQAT